MRRRIGRYGVGGVLIGYGFLFTVAVAMVWLHS